MVPLARQKTLDCQAHGFEQWQGRIAKGEPAESLERAVTGLGDRILFANISHELHVNIVTVISNNVAQAKYAKLAHFNSQLLKSLPAGTGLKGFAELQVSARRTPRRFAVGSPPLRQEDLPFPYENHAHTHQRPVCLRTHARSIAVDRGHPEYLTWVGFGCRPGRAGARLPHPGRSCEFALMPDETTDGLPVSRSGQSALTVCETAARRAGQLVLERFRTDVEVSLKGRANVVTDADLASERLILDYVAEEFPDFGILSEESAPVAGSSPYTWVVDPIDGTRNFAEGILHFCVVVAIAAGDQVVCGVTYDPVRDEMFSAQKGRGASLNGQSVTVSDRDDIDEAVLGFDLGYNFDQAKLLLELAAGVWPKVQGYRLMGSSALSLAYAACGRIDLYFHHSLSAWDIASGVLLAREAGGQVLDRATLEDATLFSPGLIVSNPALVEQFLALTEGASWRTM